MSPRTVTLYGRPHCHLCDEARAILTPLVAAAPGAELVEVDIDSDDALLARYLERIPVIEVDGSEVSALTPDAEALRAVLLHTSAG